MSDHVFELKKEKFVECRQGGLLADRFDKQMSLEAAAKLPPDTPVTLAGRVVGMRVMGKLLFAHLADFTGRLQICVRKADELPGLFDNFTEHVSIGDFVGVRGHLFITKTGELTVRVESYSLLNKALRTLPEKYHGVEDIETRYRQRYLDLIMNAPTRDVFRRRFAIVRSLRTSLEEEGFVEVETPVLQTLVSGALAKPFHTHHNALGIDCTLRIAPETFLKRCVGGGLDRVYEFARCFRNEGISATHLQDFTMLEFYSAYWNFEDMRRFVERSFKKLIQELFQNHTVTLEGHTVDFSGNWPVLEYSQVIFQDCGIDVTTENTKEALWAAMTAKGLTAGIDPQLSWANLVDTLYKKVSRPKLIQPCFLVKYPADMAPLARRNSQDSAYVDLFQFVVGGVELVKAYSELVDPLDQRQRFESQMEAREAGDEETMPLDEDYLLAMEHGFPPIAGCGIGIDRLAMILCGCENIKDTVLFPLMRPVAPGAGQAPHED